MPHIVLTAEQMLVLEKATTAVELRDEAGRVVGRLPAPTEAEIIERIKQDRSVNVPRYPAQQVEERLRRLEEIRQREGMDDARMHDLLRRMRAGGEVY